MDSSAAICCKACGTPVDTKTTGAEDPAACARCGAALTVFTDDTVAPAASADAESGGAALTDLRIPGYEIKRQVGKGGMGFVFEARQESLDRSVAIKVLAPHLGSDPQFAARFEAEAAALARVAHPNIVSIYERGRCGDRLYFVMEFVSGDGQSRPLDLKTVLSRGPLGDDEARRLIVQVMRALAVAHAEGIVHRDIKPGNILLDRHGTAKVADFGIARCGDALERERFTRPAAAMGTYDYMAPEQRADAASIDGRADVYSTAAMLYEMLTGRVPTGAFPPPSAARIGVHPSWDAVIARGMHPVPDERYATMATFLSAVEALAFDAGATAAAGKPQVEAPQHFSCRDCGRQVRADAHYCPACRAPQFLRCAACGARMRAALNGCEQCGADLQRQRSYERFVALGTAALDRARNGGPPADRIHAAQEAGLALARARRMADDDSAIAPLLAEANRIVETLASGAADEAVRANRCGEAIALLDAVLDVAPSRVDAERLRDTLVAERARGIASAVQYRDTGRPREAVRVLAELVRRFADDAPIIELLQDCERRASGLKAVVRETVPALVAEKKWFAVDAIVRQLRAENAQVAGLEELATRVEAILGGASGALAEAEVAMTSGNFHLAVRLADGILGKVADHPRAVEIRSLATKVLNDVSVATDSLRRAVGERRWFVASHAAADIPAGMRTRSTVADLLRRADAGIEQANRYAAVVCVACAGALAMTAAAFVAGRVEQGLKTALPQMTIGKGLFGEGWLAMLMLLIAIGWIGVAAAVATGLTLRRPVGRGAAAAAVMALPLFCLLALFCVAGHSWEADDGNGLPKFVKTLSGRISNESLKACAANAALWIGYGFSILRCLASIRGPSGTAVWPASLLAGLAAGATALAPIGHVPGIRSFVGPTILITSLSWLAGRIRGSAHVAALVGAGLLAGGFAGLLDQQVRWWLAPMLAVPALVTVQVIFTRPSSLAAWAAEATLVVAAVLGGRFLQHPLLQLTASFPAITPEALLVANCLAAASVAAGLAGRDEIDRRAHLSDRFATRRWAVGPASPPHQRRRTSRS